MSEISIPTYPSIPVYSVDVPEIDNFTSQFVYNFHVTDEATNDSGVLSDETIDLMNITGVILKKSQDGKLENNADLRKIPRYIKLSFTPPFKEGMKYGVINVKDDLLSKIVSEEDFSTSYYTSINTNNKNIAEQTVDSFDQNYSTVVEKLQTNFDDSDKKVLNSIMHILQQ